MDKSWISISMPFNLKVQISSKLASVVTKLKTETCIIILAVVTQFSIAEFECYLLTPLERKDLFLQYNILFPSCR